VTVTHRPALMVDCVVFGLDDEDDLKVLLIERAAPPFEARRALPGGFVRVGESLDAAALRVLADETGLADLYLEQLYTFGQVARDPRERVVTVAYYALVNLDEHPVVAERASRRAAWVRLSRARGLAFDHDEIVDVALTRLRGKVRYRPLGFELLPDKFPLRRLQRLYETLLGRSLDKRNFRKKILAMDVLDALGEVETDVPHRAARLYRFNRDRCQQLEAEGLDFEI
jgi:8-oxo-dGTP diphosphatase